jgi:DNA-binding NarL/FixJ family response regulator
MMTSPSTACWPGNAIPGLAPGAIPPLRESALPLCGAETRIVLLTDQPLLAEGLRSVLAAARDLNLAAICSSEQRLAAAIAGTGADIVLVDWAPSSYRKALAPLRSRFPALKLVFYLRSLSPEICRQAGELDAAGILDKSLPAAGFRHALRRIAAGETVFSPSLPGVSSGASAEVRSPHRPAAARRYWLANEDRVLESSIIERLGMTLDALDLSVQPDGLPRDVPPPDRFRGPARKPF